MLALTTKMTASQQAKAAGLKSLSQVSRLTGEVIILKKKSK